MHEPTGIHTPMRTHTCTHMLIHTYENTQICPHTQTCIHTCTWTYENTHIHTHTYTHTHAHTCSYTPMRIHKYAHIYKHAYTHAHMHMDLWEYTHTHTYIHTHNAHTHCFKVVYSFSKSSKVGPLFESSVSSFQRPWNSFIIRITLPSPPVQLEDAFIHTNDERTPNIWFLFIPGSHHSTPFVTPPLYL